MKLPDQYMLRHLLSQWNESMDLQEPVQIQDLCYKKAPVPSAVQTAIQFTQEVEFQTKFKYFII